MRKLMVCLISGLVMTACGTRETVVIYSPHGKEMLGDYAKLFNETYPEVHVQWLDLPSQTVYTRVSQERAKPAADIWWGGTSTIFSKAADEGLLAEYTPSWAASLPGEYKDAANRWYGTYRSPIAILYNSRGYHEEQVPGSWDELLQETWHGRITLRQPLNSGTMRVFVGAMFLRAASPTAAIQWLKTLHLNTTSYPENPQHLFDHIKRNEDILSVWLLPDIVLQRDRNGYPFGYVVPDGAPVLTEGIAIVEGAPNREWAEKFYEFVTAQEALVHQAKAYGKIPARTDIDPWLLPAWIAELDFEPMPIDWEAFAEREQDWMQAWEQQVFSDPQINSRRLTR
jgi:iron(III) transport system substrate-binding protein